MVIVETLTERLAVQIQNSAGLVLHVDADIIVGGVIYQAIHFNRLAQDIDCLGIVLIRFLALGTAMRNLHNPEAILHLATHHTNAGTITLLQALPDFIGISIIEQLASYMLRRASERQGLLIHHKILVAIGAGRGKHQAGFAQHLFTTRIQHHMNQILGITYRLAFHVRHERFNLIHVIDIVAAQVQVMSQQHHLHIFLDGGIELIHLFQKGELVILVNLLHIRVDGHSPFIEGAFL